MSTRILKNRVDSYVSANFTENETLWSGGATYNYGDEARDGHYIYKYAGVDGTNTTETPSIDYAKLATERKWVRVRPTNYFAMLDDKTQTQTSVANEIVVEIDVSNYDAIALLWVDATSVEIELTDNDTATVVFTKTLDLIDYSSIVDAYSYCFNEVEKSEECYVDTIPLYTNATMKVTISNPSATASCGRLVCGRTYYIGETGLGMNLGQESYSKKETDVFGNTTLVHSTSVNLDSYEVHIPTNSIPNIRRKFREYDAIPLLFIMDDNENTILENLLNYGYYQSLNIIVPDEQISTASLQIKGII